MKTYRTKTTVQRKEDIKRNWLLVDAKDQILGNLASQIADSLIGKHKVDYTPHNDGGDYVVVINASQVAVTGKKALNKLYTHHSNYPGGYKEETFTDLLARQPEAVIRTAVKGMLPKNRLQADRLGRLKIFAGSEHTYGNYIK
ncbi:MAG: 50S ribosomal protein L13 [bacterium]|nr:50S ribosomal protein L13 [bacterium]